MYREFGKIDARHPLRKAVPNGFVDYRVRTRRGGDVFFFNFELAKEMGLIARDHPPVLTKALRRALLKTFSLVIINEYDLIHETPIPAKDIRPYPCMATRYLQLQHPDKRGKTSGDGRSIWNGYYKGRGTLWDISSCGTGATCLSPATAIHKRFFETGDPSVSYGCGRAELIDGVGGAIMSEIFHRNGVATERTLAIISFDDDTAINVRAARNLLRPAHLFMHLKQNDYAALKGATDYLIERQVQNGIWPRRRDERRRYEDMLERIAKDFARAAARFESDYIFCWLDWDGDNVLIDGSIVDYGSVRQFGLFHHEYRYDDVERMSTTITEQKNKAKYIVQTFAQLTHFLISGSKRPLKRFARHPILKTFETEFAHAKEEALLYTIGYPVPVVRKLLRNKEARAVLATFTNAYRYFERAKSKRGPYPVTDGITWDAIFCMRDLLRELPEAHLCGEAPLAPAKFLQILRSHYATDDDLKITANRRAKVREFQSAYERLLQIAAHLSGQTTSATMRELAKRAQRINAYARVTGDAIIHVAETLANGRRLFGVRERYQMFMEFVDSQVLRPEYFSGAKTRRGRLRDAKAKAALASMLHVVEECREGI